MKHIFELYNYVRERHNIVWTFKGIFLALIKSTNKLPKNVDILFFCHDVHRHVKKNGKMYAPLLDPIIEEIEQDNECFTLASPFSKLSGKKCFGKVDIHNSFILFALLKRFFLNFSLKLMNVDSDPLIKGYEKIFKKIEPKKILAIQPSIELCIAAKKMNIKTFDVQHGIITDVNYYNLSKRHSFNQLGWPDYILCWDKESELRLKRLTDNKVNSKVIGHPSYHSGYGYLERENFQRKNNFKNLSLKKKILVSLTYLDYGVDHEDSYYKEIGIPKELVLLIKNTSEFEWLLRMHPVQLKYSHKRISKYLKNLFSNNKNVYWEEPSKTSLSQALFASVGHITVESATALDAAHNSVPTILIGCPGVSNRNKADLYFKEYLDKKIMKFVDSKDVRNLSLDFFLSEFDFQKKNKFLDEGKKNFKNFVEELKN